MFKLVLLLYTHTKSHTHIGAVKGHPSVLPLDHVTPGQVKGGSRENGGIREGVMNRPGDAAMD